MTKKKRQPEQPAPTELRIRQALFVCTGNSCRSPMAEALFNARIAGRAPWRAASAGLFAASGWPASESARLALLEIGIDLSAHRSRPVTRDQVDAADWIIPMTLDHQADLLRRFPDAARKIRRISEFRSAPESPDVPDPIGQDVFVYRMIRDRLDSAIADLILFLLQQPPVAEGDHPGDASS